MQYKYTRMQPGLSSLQYQLKNAYNAIQVCFSHFSPISHLRFWSVMVIVTATPPIMFFAYASHIITRKLPNHILSLQQYSRRYTCVYRLHPFGGDSDSVTLVPRKLSISQSRYFLSFSYFFNLRMKDNKKGSKEKRRT